MQPVPPRHAWKMTILGLPRSAGQRSLQNGARRLVVGTATPSTPNTHSHGIALPSDDGITRSWPWLMTHRAKQSSSRNDSSLATRDTSDNISFTSTQTDASDWTKIQFTQSYLFDAHRCHMGTAIIIWNFWHPCILTISPQRQSARMSKVTNDGLTRSGTGCFIAVPIWEKWASKNKSGLEIDVAWYPPLPFCTLLSINLLSILLSSLLSLNLPSILSFSLRSRPLKSS